MAPTVPSRFLLQMDAVLRASGLCSSGIDGLSPLEPWRHWARMLDAPSPTDIRPALPPAPRPPLASRPQGLSVTEISTWLRNPYAIYAKHILKLVKLEEIEAELDASDRGIMIHQALEEFVCQTEGFIPSDAVDQLLAIGQKIFLNDRTNPRVKAFWWSRFIDIANWYIEHVREREADQITFLAAEPKGTFLIDSFNLKGRADRLDRLSDGSFSIIDYKTGSMPSKTEVQLGLEPQLQLLALIGLRAGFGDVPPSASGSLEYWSLKGGRSGSKIVTFGAEDIAILLPKAEMGLRKLIASFNDPQTPYEAVPKPQLQPRFNEYAHLSRLAEWGRTEREA